jgi:hypothetical protein
MEMWADFAAPLKFHPEARTVHRLRPAFTLAHAAMESAAQALWVLSAKGLLECLNRHVTLLLWDMDEQIKAASTDEAKAELRASRDELLGVIGLTVKDFRPPTYLSLMQSAAAHASQSAPGERLDSAHVTRVWRSSAGAAHGKHWPSDEFTMTVEHNGVDYIVPNPEAMSEALLIADIFVRVGMLRIFDRSARLDEFNPLWKAAMDDLGARITRIDDSESG